MKKLLLLMMIAAFFAGNAYAQLSVEDSQILYLSFDDETELTYNDEDVDVTDESGVEYDDGKVEGAAYFDGSSFIVMDPIEDFNHGMNWSWSMWVKTESASDFWGVIGFGTYSGDVNTDYYDDEPRVGGLFLSSYEGTFNVEISWIGGLWADEANPPAPWNDGEWHHVVLVYSADDSDMKLYLDNVNNYIPEEPIAIAADIETIKAEEGFDASLDDDNIRLGCVGRGWLPEEEEEFPEIMFYEGFMDEVRLFNIALSEEEVDEIFQMESAGGTGMVQAESQLFRIYPNPANGYVQIRSEAIPDEVNIYNIAGQQVHRSFFENRIDISNLSSGVYFVEARVNQKSEVQKLVIE